MSISDELKKLYELKESGILSPHEYEAQFACSTPPKQAEYQRTPQA